MDSVARAAPPDVWTAFTQAGSVAAFCQAWASIQAETLGGARRGLVLLRGDDGSFAPAGFFPDAQTDLTDLAEPARRCLASRAALIDRLPAAPPPPGGVSGPGWLRIAYPVDLRGDLRGAVVYELSARDEAQVQAAVRALHWGIGWLDALLRGQEIERLGQFSQRARQVVDALLRVSEAADLDAAGHLAVDAVAERLGLARASLGLVEPKKSARIRLQAMSSTAWFDKRSELVRRIENAMEEAWDQQASVASPPVAGLPAALDVAHRDLAGRDSVISVLLHAQGQAIGVLCCERSGERGFDAEELAWVEAFARALGPVVALHRDAHRWFAGRLRHKLHKARLALVDPRRPAARVAIAAGVLAMLALIFADGEHRIGAPATLEGVVQRAVVSPFDSFVREAYHKAGQTVRAGEPLALLDDRDLKLEAERYRSERAQHERRYRDALARHERAEARIAAAQMAEAEAQQALVEERLARTRVEAPFDGIVVSGDLTQLLGSPVEKGKLLFEVAPLDAFRVLLRVDETDIRGVRVGQKGRLVLSGLTGDPLDFTVRNISVAAPEGGRNLFQVEATLVGAAPPRLRPGMEGVGKIDAGERGLLWIWTHRFTNWVRLKWWEWVP